jgi:hypothetical protein
MPDRRLPRLTVHAPIRFSGARTGSGIITNISPGGCRVEQTQTPAPVGADCNLAAELDLPSLQSSFLVDATVRWAQDNGFGLEFVFYTRHDQRRLHQALARLSSTHPPGTL